MRNLFLLSVLSISLCATQAQAQRRSTARKPAAPQAPVEMPQRLDLPGLHQGAANPLSDLGVLDVVGGKTAALKTFATPKGLVLIFISNTCEAVEGQKKAISDFVQQAKEAGLGVAYVNSNQRKTDELEGPPAMHAYALKAGIKLPYVIDKNMQIADVFGVQRLPEVFIFNAGGYLAYRGAVAVAPTGGKEAVCFACEAVKNIESMGRIQYTATAGAGCTIAPQE